MALGVQRHGTAVTLHWRTVSGATRDPVTDGLVGGTAMEESESVMALVYYVPATTVVRQFQEIAAGDVILDFKPEVVLEGRPELWFEFDGAEWEQKEVGDELRKIWDAVAGGGKMMQTVAVRRKN